METCLSAKDLPIVPYLSKRAMREYLKINFSVGLILPRGLSVRSSQSNSVLGGQTTNLPSNQKVSGSNSLDPET